MTNQQNSTSGLTTTPTADGNEMFIDFCRELEWQCGTADNHEGPMENMDILYAARDAMIALAIKQGLRQPDPKPQPISTGEIPF